MKKLAAKLWAVLNAHVGLYADDGNGNVYQRSY